MAKCKKCWLPVPDNAGFCPSCGEPTFEQAPKKVPVTENTEASEVMTDIEGTPSPVAVATEQSEKPKVEQIHPKKGFFCSTASRIMILIHSWIAIAAMVINAVIAIINLLFGILQSVVESIISAIWEQVITELLVNMFGDEMLTAIQEFETMLEPLMQLIDVIKTMIFLASLPAKIIAFLISALIVLLNIGVAIFGFVVARKFKTVKSKKALLGWAIAGLIICAVMQLNNLSLATGYLGIAAGISGIVGYILYFCSGEHEYGDARYDPSQQSY